ncbi:disulfide bond formation protein DsbA [Sagittula sp. SSi028]|uniref:disulfide bond formation protein DsbA n=1 Tax=Sagittula sp. SSi028 TaxID=3400636 RepID=UPI003AF43441
MIRVILPALLTAAPALAQFAPTAEERLRALTAPPAVDLYASEKLDDRARIAAEAEILFGPEHAAVAVFVTDNCTDCDKALSELRALSQELGVEMRVLPMDDPAHRAVFDRLEFDVLPAYVMPDRLIRGHMPDIVLRRYLTR